MSIEENKAIVRRYIEEIWNIGNMAVVDEVVAIDFIHHELEKDRKGPEQFIQYVSSSRTTFPDLHFTIEDQIAERDVVVSHWTMTGTHKGEFMGIAPTNKNVRIPGASITRVAGGKVAENWVYWDRLNLMQQLGAVPPPGEKK